MLQDFVGRVKRRLGREFGRGDARPRPSGPQEPGKVIDVEPDARVIRNEPPEQFLWLDTTTYETRLGRALAEGRITAEEGELLREWAAKGYLIMRGCIEPPLVEAALRDIDRVWNERWHVSVDLLTPRPDHTFIDRCPPESRQGSYKLNQLHQQSEPIRQIFLHDRIIRMIGLIFDGEVVGVNSLTFEFGSQQTTHVDHVYMTPSPARRLVASWIALEDVHPEGGPLEIWPGSHQLPPFRWTNTYPYHYIPDEQPQHERYLMSQAGRFTPELFMAKKGDVLLWHAMLAHGGKPLRNMDHTRRSMACHYFSREVFGPNAADLERQGAAWVKKIPMEDPD